MALPPDRAPPVTLSPDTGAFLSVVSLFVERVKWMVPVRSRLHKLVGAERGYVATERSTPPLAIGGPMPDDPTTGSDTEYRDINGVLRFLPRRVWGGTIYGWLVLVLYIRTHTLRIR